MISFFKYLFGYHINQWNTSESISEQEETLKQEFQNLDFEDFEEIHALPDVNSVQSNSGCYEKTGTVTLMEGTYGLIDGCVYFDFENLNFPLAVDDVIRYLVYRPSADCTPKVVNIIQKVDNSNGWDEIKEDNFFEISDQIEIGQVMEREGRNVILDNKGIKFNLDDVDASFVPIVGDWVQVQIKAQILEKERPTFEDIGQVLEVLSLRPLRSKIVSGDVTTWDGASGICNNQVVFLKDCCQPGYEPQLGDKVIVDAIESYQNKYSWRALTLILQSGFTNDSTPSLKPLNRFNNSENKNGIFIEENIIFDPISFRERKTIEVRVENKSDTVHTFIKWQVLSSRRDSQLDVQPFLHTKCRINQNDHFTLKFTCKPKVYGRSQELFIFVFEGFKIARMVVMNVVDPSHLPKESSYKMLTSKSDQMNAIKRLKNDGQVSFLSGIKPVKPPAFIPVKLGHFKVPEKLWSAVIGTEHENLNDVTFNYILMRILYAASSLEATLNIDNYTDKWHALLYLEEIECTLQMQRYNMDKAFLKQTQEFLALEVEGLAEKRPSLMIGDRVIAKDNWAKYKENYEGYIHQIRGNTVLYKFHSTFHANYTGQDISLQFHFNNSTFRKCHQAINLAKSHLGPEMLFPNKINIKNPQISKTLNISWYNTKLNYWQKEAVTNVLLGLTRPIPYCIFGPPGTGKTITVVETILQILKNIPDSRILVATPSNSSANLLTERLVEFGNVVVGSMIRLLAHYLIDSDTIPNNIKPFCATIDIAREDTAKTKFTSSKNGMKLSCRTNYIGRHRVTIATCTCLGSLAMIGLPKGHFTHIIIDEAGQATEPEIMIPMSFISKESCQVVLAGDPLQLGPVVISKYAAYFGLTESYLSRLIERSPYQRDIIGHGSDNGGYDKRLVTRLTYNYRSLSEVISLSSSLFYNNSLEPQLREEPWIVNLLTKIHDILPRNKDDGMKGGIFFCGVRGINQRSAESPSWFNPQEASMVLLFTCKLYKRNVEPEDIGIITPYIAQIKWIRNLFQTMGIIEPKIGTVEEFQGQERPIIIISTVRSSEELIGDDVKHALGFINSPKRLNVAITRAQVATVIYGNPHLLKEDYLWQKVLKYSIENHNYTGCDLPEELDICSEEIE